MAKSIRVKPERHSVGGLAAERPGGPMRFSLEQILQLFAIACEPPEDYGRPISHWTPRELASEMVKQGLSARFRLGMWGATAEADLKPHQSEYWLNPRPAV